MMRMVIATALALVAIFVSGCWVHAHHPPHGHRRAVRSHHQQGHGHPGRGQHKGHGRGRGHRHH